VISPQDYALRPPLELMEAAARGEIGLDRRLAQALLDAGERTAEDAVRFIGADRSSDRVFVLGYLGEVLRLIASPRAIPFYIQMLRMLAEEGEETPLAVEAALRSFGEAALDPLLALYEELGRLGEDPREEVAYLLATLGVRDPRILRILEDRLEVDPLGALLLMGLYRDPAARPIVERFRGSLTPGGDLYAELLRECEETLRRLDAPPEPFPDLEHPFEFLPETAPPVFSVLPEEEIEKFLDSPCDEYRLAAVEEMFRRDLDDRLGRKLLQMARIDPSVGVRAACWETIGRAWASEEAIAALKQRLADESAPAEERCGAMLGLARHAGEEDVYPFVLRFASDPATRSKAVEMMWRSQHMGFSAFIPPFLDDPDTEVRRNAVLAVGYFGLVAHLDRLRRLMRDEELRGDAIYAYALAAPAKTTPASVRSLYRKVDKEAGGLSEEEDEILRVALDHRLAMHGYPPVFRVETEEDPGEWEEEEPFVEAPPPHPKVGRNDPCPCGSGKKFKKCCGG